MFLIVLADFKLLLADSSTPLLEILVSVSTVKMNKTHRLTAKVVD